jgi:hypothetical protein
MEIKDPSKNTGTAKSGVENEKMKISITSEMTFEEIQKICGDKVHRATIFRAMKKAKEEGSAIINLNYHQKQVMPDPEWIEKHQEEVVASARAGVWLALKIKNMRIEDIRPFSFRDLHSTALVRLIELGGHPNRENEHWRTEVARNAVFNFLESEVIAHSKVNKENELDLEKRNRRMGF